MVAAAVILPPGLSVPGLDDSKALSEKKRDSLFDILHREAHAVSVAAVSAQTIDRINIRQASLLAMRLALTRLAVAPQAALFDGRDVPDHLPAQLMTQAVIGGDAKCMSIAAASIIAKVTRDRMLQQLDGVHPQYGFASHKGYGSARVHQEAIAAHGGATRVHRMSFAPFRQGSLF